MTRSGHSTAPVIADALRSWPALLVLCLAACSRPTRPEPVVIDLAAAPVARFSPDIAFGAVIDGLGKGRVAQSYAPGNIRALKRAGLGATAYNLRTELAIEAWHWSSEGAWSDPAHARGYWTGSDHPRHPVLTAWGYRLPRRGDSTDQANDDGYSRLDDGDHATFWKSNPYLDPRYSRWPGGEQWVVVNFRKPTAISAARIDWALPYARTYRLQYWVGSNEIDPHGRWRDFPHGRVTGGTGGSVIIRLSKQPFTAQYFRVLLQQSSHSAPAQSRDSRDAMGFAIRELGLGMLDQAGLFHDAVVHSRTGSKQTNIYVSSTDPWHRAGDRDPETEQPGFDRIVRSGLTNGLPIVLNVGTLYDTPENTAATIRFFRHRHYPIREVEIGMEPDGQNVAAGDFAALFLQAADAVHRVDPQLRLASPSLQDAVAYTWLAEGAVNSWPGLFIAALRKAGRLGDLDEFTFEHYPFDVPCGAPPGMLRTATERLSSGMARLTADGVPPGLPRSILEYGMSAFSGRIQMEMPEALFDADFAAHFLTLGGTASYYLGYGPEELFDPETACAGYGELMLFGQDRQGRATWPTPAFWSAQLVTQAWSQPGSGRHLLYTAKWLPDRGPSDLITVYPVRRPDGQLAVLLINRDAARAHVVDLQVRRRDSRAHAVLRGPYDIFQYGAAQYSWQAAGAAGHPTRNQPPRHFIGAGPVTLPPTSLTVVRSRDPG